MRAVVLGASGVVGSALVPALAERCEVVAVSRSGRTPPADHVEPMKADVTDAEAMARVLQGADVVYYLVHSLGAADFSAVDRRAAETVARAAADAGVPQIVYLGGLGDDQPTCPSTCAAGSRPPRRWPRARCRSRRSGRRSWSAVAAPASRPSSP